MIVLTQKNKGNALRPSEPSVVRECPNATRAGGSCFSEGDYRGSAHLQKLGAARSYPPRATNEWRTSTATDFRAYMA
jgi:hypothetical protein